MKNILLALLNLFAIQIFAQIDGVDVKISPKFQYEYIDLGNTWKTFLTPDNNLLAITDFDPGFSSTVIDLNGKDIVSKKEYNTVFKDQNFVYGGGHYNREYIQIADKLYAFGSKTNKPNEDLIALPVNMKTGKPNGETKTVISLRSDAKASDTHISMFNSSIVHAIDIAQHYINYSSDRSKLVVMYEYKALVKTDSGKHKKIGLVIIDKNLNKVSSSEILLPHSDKEATRILYFTSDSKNNVYLLTEVTVDHKRKYELDVVSPNSENVKAISLENNDQFGMEKISIAENKNGNIYAYGYTNANTAGVMNAIPLNLKLYKIDIAKSISKQIIDAPLDFRKSYLDEYLKSNKIYGSLDPNTTYYKLYAQEIIIREDGSMILIGAGHFGSESGATPSFDQGFIASYVDASGKLIWTRNIFNDYCTVNRYRPILLGSDGMYIVSPVTDYKQKTKDGVLKNIILSKISFDGKQTDKVILMGFDKIINLMISEDCKTLTADVAYGYTINKEKSKQKLPAEVSWISDITDQIVNVTLK